MFIFIMLKLSCTGTKHETGQVDKSRRPLLYLREGFLPLSLSFSRVYLQCVPVAVHSNGGRRGFLRLLVGARADW